MISLEVVVLITCVVVASRGEERKSKTGTDEMTSRIMFPNDFLLENYRRQQHQRNHHYQAYFNNRKMPEHASYGYHTPEDSQSDYFDDADIDDISNNYNNSINNEIPLDFIQNINKYNISDLLLNFVEGDMDYDEPVIKSRFGEDYEARSAAVTPKPAGCTPELKTVSLATADDPSILFIPQCTKVERCGGCCSHALLSCQPKEIETLSYKVLKTQYNPNAKKLKFLEKEIVTVEKHVKCKCDCKVKEESCNKYQEYRPSECSCVCTNIDEETKCFKSESKKLWNSELCACQCREMLECSTGFYFDQLECKCMPNPKRRFANYNRGGYEAEPLTETPPPVDN